MASSNDGGATWLGLGIIGGLPATGWALFQGPSGSALLAGAFTVAAIWRGAYLEREQRELAALERMRAAYEAERPAREAARAAAEVAEAAEIERFCALSDQELDAWLDADEAGEAEGAPCADDPAHGEAGNDGRPI